MQTLHIDFIYPDKEDKDWIHIEGFRLRKKDLLGIETQVDSEHSEIRLLISGGHEIIFKVELSATVHLIAKHIFDLLIS